MPSPQITHRQPPSSRLTQVPPRETIELHILDAQGRRKTKKKNGEGGRSKVRSGPVVSWFDGVLTDSCEARVYYCVYYGLCEGVDAGGWEVLWC
jgi:hypothetical protein